MPVDKWNLMKRRANFTRQFHIAIIVDIICSEVRCGNVRNGEWSKAGGSAAHTQQVAHRESRGTKRTTLTHTAAQHLVQRRAKAIANAHAPLSAANSSLGAAAATGRVAGVVWTIQTTNPLRSNAERERTGAYIDCLLRIRK